MLSQKERRKSKRGKNKTRCERAKYESTRISSVWCCWMSARAVTFHLRPFLVSLFFLFFFLFSFVGFGFLQVGDSVSGVTRNQVAVAPGRKVVYSCGYWYFLSRLLFCVVCELLFLEPNGCHLLTRAISRSDFALQHNGALHNSRRYTNNAHAVRHFSHRAGPRQLRDRTRLF